jgi:hypothetical protein
MGTRRSSAHNRQPISLALLLITIVLSVAFNIRQSQLLMIGTVEDEAKDNASPMASGYKPFRNLVDIIPEMKHNNKVGVCVAVRTYYKQSTALTTLLLSLREAASKVPPGKMSLFVYVVDTEGQQWGCGKQLESAPQLNPFHYTFQLLAL